MYIDGKNYTLDTNNLDGKINLRDKLPKYDIFFVEKIEAGSYEDKLNKDPISTTNPNLHMIHDSDKVITRSNEELPYKPDNIFDRQYKLLGAIGTQIYSSVEAFVHDEEDTEFSEVP